MSKVDSLKARRKKTPLRDYYNVSKEEMVIRDHLAADRTSLANERTYLSYIRTALAFSAAGFGLIKFTPTTEFIVIGWILIAIGIFFAIFGTYRFIKFRISIRNLGCDSKTGINDLKEKE